MLFWRYDVPHPATLIYPRVESLVGEHPDMGLKKQLPPFPFVLKGNMGGEGRWVWFIDNEELLQEKLAILERQEWKGQAGFVIQEYIPEISREASVACGHVPFLVTAPIGIHDKLIEIMESRIDFCTAAGDEEICSCCSLENNCRRNSNWPS